MAELATTQPDTELFIALGHARKVLARPRDAQRYLHTVAIQCMCMDVGYRVLPPTEN